MGCAGGLTIGPNCPCAVPARPLRVKMGTSPSRSPAPFRQIMAGALLTRQRGFGLNGTWPCHGIKSMVARKTSAAASPSANKAL